MRYSLLLLLVALVGLGQTARAQAPSPGSCSLGISESDLDVNNVFARVFNTGSLFFGNTTTNADGYLVPKSSGNSPIFASGLWVGGKVGGELRLAGATYSGYNFWPGPLNASTHRPVNPSNCTAYDKIYNVRRSDILAFEGGSAPTADLANWPYQLGAPVIDGDGNPDNYNLNGGDRPDIIGDQGIWWVMNDVGGPHTANATPPLGIEVQVLAWAFSRSDAIGNTTFYRYRVINKSGSTIEQTYLSVFSDTDLGDGADDYVGSDVAAGLGYVYNGNDTDASYGIPPALGYDFFQGPIVNGDTLGTSSFSYFNNTSGPSGDPSTGTDRYFYQQGLWGDGTPMRAFKDGYQETQGEVTKFAFPGDPVTGQAWSEVNPGPGQAPNPPDDRRFLISTGPFTLNDGDEQDIVFGIVFAQGADRFDSITQLRAADVLAQTAYDAGFQLPPPPPAPDRCTDETGRTPTTADDFGSGKCLEAIAQSGKVTLVFGYPNSSPNFLGQYEVFDVFLTGQNAADSTYNFEGFKIYRYPTSNFDLSSRQLVATLDIKNGIPPDNGLQYSYDITNLTNYTDYFYGVSAYAYNAESEPQELESQATLITVRPGGLVGGVETQSTRGDSVSTVATNQVGGGIIRANVVDPTIVTGDTYEVVFFNPTRADGTVDMGVTTYSIVNSTTGTTLLDGQAYYASTGNALPQRENVFVAEGISFSITGPAPAVTAIDERDSSGAIIDPSLLASLNSPSSRPPTYLVSAQGAAANDVDAILDRLNFGGFLLAAVPREYEVRWVDPAQGQVIVNRSWDGTPGQGYLTCYETGTVPASNGAPTNLQTVTAPVVGGYPRMPFQLWEIDPDGTERQVHAAVLDSDGDNCYSFDTPANTGSAPYSSTAYERIYGSRVPYVESELSDPEAVYDEVTTLDNEHQAFGRLTVVLRAGPAIPPKPGTRIHIATTKPNLAGDRFTINSSGLGLTEPTEASRQAALDRIAAVPNPYMGTSSYETGNLSRVVRFTNLPQEVTTIRIFTVSGSLVQTLRKEGSSRSLDWNLETSNNLPVASGMYLVHVEVEGVGERTLKLGVINRRTQVTIF